MVKFFGIPILLAFFLGFYFPFTALSLSPYAFVILFFMMMTSVLDFRWTVIKKVGTYKTEILVGLFFLFLFFPLFQWFFAKALIVESSLFFGVIFASICPIALVAPQFTKMHKGDEDLSVILMMLSMALFPIMTMTLLQFSERSVHIRPIFVDMCLLLFVPVFLSELIKKLDVLFFKETLIPVWRSRAGEINMISIAMLTFIYLGASVSKINLNYTPWSELFAVAAIVFFQDFGVYFLASFITKKLFSPAQAKALSISIAMKNLALSGTVLLFYDPKASLASAIGFVAHAFFFNFLIFMSKDESPGQ